MRYFIELSYNGTHFAGWQRQPNALTIQEHLENAFNTVLETSNLPIVGCGRTDSGVHAKNYFAHIDLTNPLPDNFLNRINRFIGPQILIQNMYRVPEDAHARFDAIDRTYTYFIGKHKDPFRQETLFHDAHFDQLDIYILNECAALLQNYDEYLPFSKTNSDVKHYKCHLIKCQWVLTSNRSELIFEIQANRFLRGMVRLIVGCCRQVCLNKITIEQVRYSLEHQTALPKAYSAPAKGLFFSEINYPDEYLKNPVFDLH